ncbi:trimeric intracellular cation channel family protein [Amycolatopsis pigmentata]|uniref:Trimeric intracellular cation channel family protein n=1 Tax=Amycolatopsis pigmentata TaxID=450801 RepID=A0ABW5G2B6_9PSEU
MLSILEAIGIIALAITGAAEGVRARLDLFGVVVTATIMTLGGGIARDILLGVHPPLGLLTLWYLVACAVTAVLVFLCYPWLAKLKTVIQFADAIALGMFTITGASAAIQHGAPAYTAAAVGLANGVAGGAVVDMLLRRTPKVLREEIYALPSLGGGFLLALGYRTGIPRTEVTLGVVALIVAVRMLALRLNWHLPVGRHERHANPLPPEESLLGFSSANWPTIELPAVKPSSPKLLRRGAPAKPPSAGDTAFARKNPPSAHRDHTRRPANGHVHGDRHRQAAVPSWSFPASDAGRHNGEAPETTRR